MSVWQRMSFRLRLFLSLSFFTLLVSGLSIWALTLSVIDARVENMTQAEIPNRLHRMKAEVSLIFAPHIQMAQVIAEMPDLAALVSDPVTDEKRAQLRARLSGFYQGLGADTLALSPSPQRGSTYYQYRDGVLHHRPMHQGDPDDAWYLSYVASKRKVRAELDSNTLSGDRRMLFINAHSQADDGQGNPLLVSSVALDARAVSDIIRGFRIGERGFVSLVSPGKASDAVIDIMPEGAMLGSLKEHPGFAQLLNPGLDTVVEMVWQGKAYYLASIWVESLSRFLVMELPKAQLIDPIRAQSFRALGISVLLLFLSLLLLYPLISSLTRPLRRVQEALGTISRSLDLNQQLLVPDRAEIGQLATEINQLLKRLLVVIRAIQDSSGQLNGSAILLAQTAGLRRGLDSEEQSMASAIEQMSASVAEITSTMEEFSASSTQIAERSESVADMAKGALEASQRGTHSMAELAQQMATIQADHGQSLIDILALGEQSQGVGKVMELINGLADQTRLIAFNAALEASSSGESGRRFSVVASEIRRLADSVSSSINGIEQHIQSIQAAINRLVVTSEKSAKSVQSGLEISASTAAALDRLVDVASHTSDAALQISLSTKQQKTASSQVTIALRTIASASASNAKSMRNVSTISEELLGLASRLEGLVREFRL